MDEDSSGHFGKFPKASRKPLNSKCVMERFEGKVALEAMSDIPVGSRAAAREALAKLARPSRFVIVALGGNGFVVVSKVGGRLEIAPVPVRVTSTHGAGDCFVGALCAQLAAACVSRPS